MTRPCYRCREGRPALIGQGLCGPCFIEVRESANRKPDSEVCSTCGYRFFRDWERVKHELIGSHHYRAWNPALQEKQP